MLKAAPPMFVVAMITRVLWLPWIVFEYLIDLPPMSAPYVSIDAALTTCGILAMVAAMAELASRTRGATRTLLVVATVASALVLLAVTISGYFAVLLVGYIPPDLYVLVLHWTNSILWLIAWLAFIAAGWNVERRTAIILLVLTLLLDTVPPVRSYLREVTGANGPFALFTIATPLRSLFTILFAGAIAKRAYEPARDHGAAARNAVLIAATIIAIAVIQLVSAAGATRVAEQLSVRVAASIAQVLAALLFAIGMWRLAQKQLPALLRYRVHVAAVVALATAVMLMETFTFSTGTGIATGFHAAVVEWWHLVPTTVALACLITILLTYANHRDAVYRPTLIGGALFILGVAGWFILKDHPVISPVSLACGYLALVPAVLQMSRELATDRVETTADVFA